MILKIQFLLLILVGFLMQRNHAQSIQHEAHDHHHDHHKNEIGVANSPVYFVGEEEFAYGLHVHFVRNISDTKFGIGIGYERIFDEHKHNTWGAVFSYRPIDRVGINISPGITFEDAEGAETNFALHFEASYEIEFNNFHIGPVFEIAYDPEDYHISLGLHIGYGF